jgi:hypothetical protein
MFPVGFEVSTTVNASMKNAVFWDAAPCGFHNITSQKTAFFNYASCFSMISIIMNSNFYEEL